jgi:20S proteasome alpha/beta subunit
MTLVLAIRFRDGVVLASDGQCTADTAGQPTRQPARKLFDLGGRIAWGASGSVGLQQTLRERLAAAEPLPELATADLRLLLGEEVAAIQQDALHRYVPHPGTDPPDLACLFCGVDESGPWIVEVPRTGADHQFHDGVAAIGSGDIFARVLLRSADTAALDAGRAKMVAYAAVADAIDLAAFFLGPPIQMAVVTRAGVARVPREELDVSLPAQVRAWRERQRRALAGPPSERRARARPRRRGQPVATAMAGQIRLPGRW